MTNVPPSFFCIQWAYFYDERLIRQVQVIIKVKSVIS